MPNIAVAGLDDCVRATCRNGHNINTTGKILAGSSITKINGKPLARVGDSVILRCGHTCTVVEAGASKVLKDENKKAAMVGTQVQGANITGSIILGDALVNII